MTRAKRYKRPKRRGNRFEIDEERMEWYERIKGEGAASKVPFEGSRRSRKRLHKGDLFHTGKARLPKRPRYYRIRDSSWRARGHSHSCHHDFQAENRRAVERDHDGNPRSLKELLHRGKDADAWFKRALTGKLHESHGQSTVEYALVSVAFLAIVFGLGALSDLLGDGVVVSHAISAASHGIQNAIGGATDVFSF